MKKQSGFTLVELMVVVLIIGILGAIAYPSYQESVRKARRADAQAVLGEVAQWMERYYSNSFSYTSASLPSTLQASPKDGSTKFYTISIAIQNSGKEYTATATPKGAQADNGILTLNNKGEKGWDNDNSGSIGNDEKCWKESCS